MNRQLTWSDIGLECRRDVYADGMPDFPYYEVRIRHVPTGLEGFARSDVCNALLSQVERAAQEQLLEQLNALSMESYGGSAA